MNENSGSDHCYIIYFNNDFMCFFILRVDRGILLDVRLHVYHIHMSYFCHFCDLMYI